MANETTSAQLTGIITDITAEVISQFNLLCGIKETVRWKDTQGKPGKTVDFPEWSTVASSDVTEVAEGTDHSTNKQLTNTATEATLAEHVVMGIITDLADFATDYDAQDEMVKKFVNGILAKLEDDVVNLYSGFSQTIAGAGVTMTLPHWHEALEKIQTANGDISQLNAVVSPKQMWGAKGITNIFTADSDQFGGLLSENLKQKGFTLPVAGIPVKVSNEINQDVASGGDAAGAIYSKDAIGVHWKGITIEAERNASLRGYEVVCTGRWKEVELVDTRGVYFLSDVS